MTSFDHSQLAQSLLIPLEHRLRDLRDYLERVPLPEKWSISGSILPPQDGMDLVSVNLSLTFPSYKEALSWAWMHTKCHDESRGCDARVLLDTFIAIQMNDFTIHLSFPPATHPDRLNPELAHLKPATA